MANLSPRERQVLDLLCQGKTVKEIAGILSISHYTVKEYILRARYKSRVDTTHALISLFRVPQRGDMTI
jgi:DNA-binding CsgD family transcriptional regulator